MKTINKKIYTLISIMSIIAVACILVLMPNSVSASSSSSSSSTCLRCPGAPSLSVSCVANPSSIQTGQSTTFTASPTGGTGSYTYSWTGTDALSGSSSFVSKTYSTAGTKTATVTVISGTQTKTANCSVTVTEVIPTLSVSCIANPSSIQTNQSTTFTANANGGTDSYTYSWSGTDGLSGSVSFVSKSYYTPGTKTATVVVVSGTQTQSANCSVSVNQSCTPNYEQRCVGNSMYWYDSCGAQGSYVGTCGTVCTPNYQQRCVGNSMYWYDSCGAQGSYVGTCGIVNTTLTLAKTVRNLTSGSTTFTSSVYANPSDMVMFMITLQNNGSQSAQNVLVRDILPTNLIYNNQLVVACTGNTSNCSNNYGNITSGISLYTVNAGQTVTITYQAQVAGVANFSYGTTTLTNTASLTGSQINYVPNASASVIVTRSGVLGASTVSTGLTNNFWVDSFFLPLLLTLIGLWMWKTGMFLGIEKWLDNKKKTRRGYRSEKELSARITQLRK